MWSLLAYAEEQIKIAKSDTKVDRYNPDDQILEDLVRYELNFKDECHDFCESVNYQLDKTKENIEEMLRSLKEQEIIEIENENSENIINESENDPDIIEEFNTDINDIANTTLSISELQLMMNLLANYQEKVNSNIIKHETNRIQRERELLKTQKNRALDYLYEIQDYCADLLQLDKH